MDIDFADVTRFPPADAYGLVVIRIPRNPSLTALESLIRQFLSALTRMTVERMLWIVEMGRIRMHQSDDGGQVAQRAKVVPMCAGGETRASEVWSPGQRDLEALKSDEFRQGVQVFRRHVFPATDSV